MSKYGPSSTFLLVGGRDISTDTFKLEESVEQVLEEARGFSETWDRFLPAGLAKAMLDAGDGFYDDRVGGIVEALANAGATQQLVSWGVAGNANGAEVAIASGSFVAKWKRMAKREGLTRAHAEYSISGALTRARVLHGLTPETGTTGNTQATSVDATTQQRPKKIINASVANPTVLTCAEAHGLTSGDTVLIAGSTTTPTIDGSRVVTVVDPVTFTVPVNVTNGGAQTATWVPVTTTGAIVDLHVPALTLGGWTSVTVLVRDSADNVTFANLTGGTFTNVATLGANQRLTVAGQVRRYMAMQWTFNGAGSGQSITPYVAIAR